MFTRNVRFRTLLLANTGLMLVLLMISLGMRQPLLERFATLERELMSKKIASVADDFLLQTEKLDGVAKSEANWTEMHTYLGNKEAPSDFYTDNFSFSNPKEDIWTYEFMLLLDRQGRPRHFDWNNIKTKQLEPVPSPLRQQILNAPGLDLFPNDNDPVLDASRNIFVMPTSSGAILLVARPVLTSNGNSPRNGAVILGKTIDQYFINRLTRSSNLKAKLIPIPQDTRLSVPVLPDQFLQISPEIQTLNDQWLSSNIHLFDGVGKPVYSLQVQYPRLEYQQGVEMLNKLTAILFGLGVTLGVVISWLLDRSLRHWQLLQAVQTSLSLTNQELEKLAHLDGLTKLANRRAFDQFLQQEWSLAQRNETPLTLILCDIDYFKCFNDTNGHLLGDDCLVKVAQALKDAIKRPTDFVARYGGEEFAVILPDTSISGGMKVARQIQDQVNQLKIEHRGAPSGKYLTISIGVACMIPLPNSSIEMLIAQSDQNLYKAKQRGRNQVYIDQSVAA